MKKCILMISLLLYASSSFAYITFYNYCEDCSSIRITITVPATPGNPSYEEELLLGDYYSSVAYEIPHYGYYIIRADCLEGIDYLWGFNGYYNTYSSYDKFLYCTSTMVVNHMMTKDPKASTSCETPVSTTTFYSDEMAYCWVSVDNAVFADRIVFMWYGPDSAKYQEWANDFITSGPGCAWSPFDFQYDAPTNLFGNWRVDIYYNQVFQCSENFTIIGYTSTTSTTKPITSSTVKTTTSTTSITPKTTSTIPVPVPTTTSSYPSTSTAILKICPIEEIYGEDSEEVDILKFIRDYVLSTTPEGQEIIRLYYELSPVIIKMMNDDEFKEQVREIIDMILELIQD